MGGRKVVGHVTVGGVTYPPGVVPDDVASQINAPGVFEDDKPGSGPPPRAGAGSGRDAWVSYAESVGVTVPDGASRDEIVQAVQDAGSPVD